MIHISTLAGAAILIVVAIVFAAWALCAIAGKAEDDEEMIRRQMDEQS